MNWLDRLKQAEEVKTPTPSEETLLKTVQATCDKIIEEERRIPEPPMADADQELLDWFTTANLPQDPFYLDQARRVTKPVLFYAGLRREIEYRQTSPRWRCKATQANLRCLKGRCERWWKYDESGGC